ncbi:MAG: hypothetical protein Q8910_02455 [Bacteroidota bacterium]|nr:hypothetical protein [Bacteroidota bacterium]
MDKQSVLKELRMFARCWHREKLISGSMLDFYQGRYHGASAVLILADIITDEELKEIDKEAEEEAKISV